MASLIEYRRILHRHPELSGKEIQTCHRVKEWLKEFQPSSVINLGETGLLAVFESKRNGPNLMFRSELDALPITETNDFYHKSLKEGISHKCGHDGHTAILLGLASQLSINPPRNGIVYLLFQPAEETGEGAKIVGREMEKLGIKPDFVFALHNIPGEKEGNILIRESSFTAAVKSVIIELQGETSHAAEPEMGKNPALAVAGLLQEFHKLQVEDTTDKNFCLVTPVQVILGEEAFGTSAGHAVLKFTIRAWNQENLRKLEAEMLSVSKKIAREHQLGIEFSFTQGFEANQNDKEAVGIIENAAQEAGLEVIHKSEPFKWGEDFGYFTQRYKGAMFGLGAGEHTPPLHNESYDFPDEIIPVGVEVFHRIIKKLNG